MNHVPTRLVERHFRTRVPRLLATCPATSTALQSKHPPWAMVRNIIEDSDDEGDFGALSPVASRESSPVPTNPANEKTPRSQKSAPGTSSTGALAVALGMSVLR